MPDPAPQTWLQSSPDSVRKQSQTHHHLFHCLNATAYVNALLELDFTGPREKCQMHLVNYSLRSECSGHVTGSDNEFMLHSATWSKTDMQVLADQTLRLRPDVTLNSLMRVKSQIQQSL